MEIKIHSAVIIDKNFEEYIKNKFGKLKKFLFDEGNAELHIKKEGPMYVGEIKVHSKSYDVFVKEKNTDLNKSMEGLFDKAKRQASKIHDKVVNRPHK
jgi:ribosomal subunit interface protein